MLQLNAGYTDVSRLHANDHVLDEQLTSEVSVKLNLKVWELREAYALRLGCGEEQSKHS